MWKSIQWGPAIISNEVNITRVELNNEGGVVLYNNGTKVNNKCGLIYKYKLFIDYKASIYMFFWIVVVLIWVLPFFGGYLTITVDTITGTFIDTGLLIFAPKTLRAFIHDFSKMFGLTGDQKEGYCGAIDYIGKDLLTKEEFDKFKNILVRAIFGAGIIDKIAVIVGMLLSGMIWWLYLFLLWNPNPEIVNIVHPVGELPLPALLLLALVSIFILIAIWGVGFYLANFLPRIIYIMFKFNAVFKNGEQREKVKFISMIKKLAERKIEDNSEQTTKQAIITYTRFWDIANDVATLFGKPGAALFLASAFSIAQIVLILKLNHFGSILLSPITMIVPISAIIVIIVGWTIIVYPMYTFHRELLRAKLVLQRYIREKYEQVMIDILRNQGEHCSQKLDEIPKYGKIMDYIDSLPVWPIVVPTTVRVATASTASIVISLILQRFFG